MIELETWIKYLWHYQYFQQGLGVLNQAKYLILAMGLLEAIKTSSLKFTAVVAIIYGISAYVVGWLCYHSKFMRASTEISNRINPLADELRAHMQKQNERKH